MRVKTGWVSMLLRIAHIACVMVLSMHGANWAARADELADFNAAVEAASAHNRVAIGYLRTGNVDLASIEIDRLRNAWSRLTERFSDNRPAVFAGNMLYGKLFTVVSARLVAADIMLKTGRLDAVRDSLNTIRGDLYDLRKASGVVVLADCVRDANAIMDAMMTFDRVLDWEKPEKISDLTTRATTYGTELDRCDGIASDAVRTAPEFRRLVDGAKTSLRQIPKATAARDADLVHRLLIELRSFDNLLAFRYG